MQKRLQAWYILNILYAATPELNFQCQFFLAVDVALLQSSVIV